MTMPFLVCAAITAVSAFVSLGFSIAAVPGASGETRTLALYACARSIALAIICVVPFVTGWILWLDAVAVGMIILQVLGHLCRSRNQGPDENVRPSRNSGHQPGGPRVAHQPLVLL